MLRVALYKEGTTVVSYLQVLIVGSITTNNNNCWKYLYGLMASLLHKWFRLSCKNKIWPDAIVYLTKFTEPQ